MLERAHAAAGDHRDRDRVDDRPGQVEIETRSCPVAIHRGQQDLARAASDGLARPFDRIDAGRRAPAVQVDLPRRFDPVGRVGTPLGVDGAHDALRTELGGDLA